METHDRIAVAVVGLGNILLRDEGVGVRVIERLNNEYSFSPPIKIIDGGTLGFALINELEGCDKLIVVDAVKTDEEPGTIYRFTKDDLEFKIPQKMSVHDIGFFEVLEQWKILGINPEVVFIGIEPKDMHSWGMELSECIQNKVNKLMELVIDELQCCGIRVMEK